MSMVRIQKYLAHAGVCSRRHAERAVVEGRVAVNGEVIRKMGTHVDPDRDRITVDGKPVSGSEPRVYVKVHKPRGVVTSCDHPGQKVITDLVDIPERVYPVGRLDKDSTGLVILTNDGEVHHMLSHPSFDHEKEYVVEVASPVADDDLARMRKGMRILGSRTRPAKVQRMGPCRFRIFLKEGRNRQIRRMVDKVGNDVVRLHRVRMGKVRLGDLPEGEWRYLSDEEERSLLAEVVSERRPKRSLRS
ncbi:MAG: pseudouridine synthase [Desulfatibacillaceae bacterium]